MNFENLSDEDIQLIKSSMISHSVTILAECQECSDIMSEESYSRDMKESERLIYLVNVLNDTREYDSKLK